MLDSNISFNHSSAIVQEQRLNVDTATGSHEGSSGEEHTRKIDIVEPGKVKVGDKIAGVTVQSVEMFVSGKYISSITFAGEIELVGTFQWVDERVPSYMFTVDKIDMYKLPKVKYITDQREQIRMLIINTAYAENFLPKDRKGIKAKVVIDNFYSGMTEIRCSADLIKVIEVYPQKT